MNTNEQQYIDYIVELHDAVIQGWAFTQAGHFHENVEIIGDWIIKTFGIDSQHYKDYQKDIIYRYF